MRYFRCHHSQGCEPTCARGLGFKPLERANILENKDVIASLFAGCDLGKDEMNRSHLSSRTLHHFLTLQRQETSFAAPQASCQLRAQELHCTAVIHVAGKFREA